MNKDRLIYGLHAVEGALKNSSRKINCIFATDNGLNSLSKNINVSKYNVKIKQGNEISAMLPEGAVHQGVVLDCSPLSNISLKDLIAKASNKDKSVVLLLDQVSDPHNIGAIIRSTSALGGDAVIVQDKNSPEINGLIAKTACGGIEEAPLIRVVNLARALEELKDNGYWVVGLDERGKCNIDSTNLKGGKVVLVLGAEGPGIRDLIVKKCDLLARIPMSENTKVASINVSNAAAISLYEFLK